MCVLLRYSLVPAAELVAVVVVVIVAVVVVVVVVVGIVSWNENHF